MTESLPDLLKDPVEEHYDAIKRKLRKITWRQFEDLVAAIMSEAGFVDVHRLSSGSQQGKDVVGTWDSRLCLGTRIRFRFQAKHKEVAESVNKSDVGDSISDFLAQDQDKILLIITNGTLSNDLIDQIDRLMQKGQLVQAIAGDRFVRLLGNMARASKQFLGLEESEREALHHFFDFRNWIETLAMQADSRNARFTLCRYWTEPYTWFFHKLKNGQLERFWTTDGGDLRLSISNPTEEIQPLGRVVLRIIKKEPLPEYYVINMTPKGGHGIKPISIPLGTNKHEFILNDDGPLFLEPHKNFFRLLRFEAVDPGIYHFCIRCEGMGGNFPVRESEEYVLVSLGKEYSNDIPINTIQVYESWPISFVMIELLLNLPRDKMAGYFASFKRIIGLYSYEKGQIFIKLFSTDEFKNQTIVDKIPVSTQYKEILKRTSVSCLLRFMRETPATVTNSLDFSNEMKDSKRWYEELTDSTEPRGICNRAFELSEKGMNKSEVLEVLDKAYERIPLHASLSASYGCLCYKIGYLGFAKFYIENAFQVAPYIPAIAALRYTLRKKLGDESVSQREHLLALDNEKQKNEFQTIVDYIERHPSFPVSFHEAELAPFKPAVSKDDPKLNEIPPMF